MTVSTLAPRARRRMVASPPPHPVTQYALDVVAGRVVAGELVRKACERHLSDLSNDRGLWFDEHAATKAIEFFGLLRHYKGDLGREDNGRGAFVHLEAWQQFIIGAAFGWKRPDGSRRFRNVYLEVAKKNGKTLMGAGVALLLTFFDGEPGAEFYSIATKEDQARLSWNDGAQFVAKNASIARRIRKVGKRLVNESTASFWMPLGRDSDVGDQGINAIGGLVDELHVLADRDPIDNLETATSSRSQPMIWKITTAGVKRESAWAEERADAVAIVEGRATDDSTLVLIYTLDDTRTVLYGSSQALRYMIQSCTCRQRDTGSTSQPARSTPTEPQSAGASAIPAIGATSRVETPSTPQPSMNGSSAGQTTIESGSERPNADGRLKTPGGRSNATDSFDSESLRSNTIDGSPLRTPAAPSAANGPTSSASTTTTLREWSEGSSAGSATVRSDSSGILSSAYLAHSPTCAARSSSTLQGDGLRVTIPGDDPFDEAVWPKANPNLGVSVNVPTLREQAEKAKRSPAKLAPFLRFRMNVPTAVATRAIDIDEWDRCSGLHEGEDYHAWEERTFAEPRKLYGGLDLASVRDLTALILATRDDDGYDVLCRFFCPKEGIEHRSRVDGVPYADWVRDGYLIATEGNVTDYDYVKAEAGRLAEKHDIREIGFDRWNATQLATDLQAEGATLVAVPQTHSGLAPGWRELDKAILEHKLRHGGHPILRWMAGNVEVETDAAGNQKPSKRMSSERIDGMVALDMAIGRWIVHIEEEVPKPFVIVGRAR